MDRASHTGSRDEGGTVEFVYTAEDFVASYKLAATPTRRTWLLYLLASVALFAFLTGPDDSWPKILVVTLSWLGLAILGGLLQWGVYVPWRARRVYARYPLAKVARRFSLREDGLQMRNERGDITMHWSDFTRWRANRETILLYTSPGGAFMLVPARLEERGFPIEGLKAALRRELGPPRR
jgi:hypothetical protein